MFRTQFGGRLRNSIKVFLAAGVLSLGFPGLSAQAATVTIFDGDEAGWLTAAGLLGPIVTEGFADATLIPELSITLGAGPPQGDCLACALPGSISGGVYNDRANDLQTIKPLLTFTGPGAFAFGADWNLGPNSPGTGIEFFITFADASLPSVVPVILNPSPGVGYVDFFGIISDVPILSIRLDEGPQAALFETFSLDDAQLVAVPIPAALPLFLSAIAGLAFVARRRRQTATM